MRLEGEDWYFRDKSLAPGDGHDRLAHRFAALTLVLYGRLEERFASQSQPCGAWRLHYKPAGIPHETATGARGVRMFLLGLGDRWVDRLRLTAADQPRLLGTGGAAARALRRFLEVIAARTPAEREGSLAAMIDEVTEVAEPPVAESPPVWITEVDELVRATVDEPRSLAGLAGRFRVHPVYLARAFRRHYGTSIGAVRRRARVDRALELLAGRSATLAEVALAAGYADQSHLCRELKRETGWSPGRFSRQATRLGRLQLG